MKQIIAIAMIAGMAMISCKKDRVCSCKTITSTTVGSATVTSGVDEEYTMVKTGYRAAYYHCTHKKASNTYGSVVVEVDQNCSLK